MADVSQGSRNALREARLRKGLSPKQLADRVGCTSLKILRAEAGATPRPYIVHKLARALDSTPEALGLPVPRLLPLSREMAGMNARNLAKGVGMDHNTWGIFERGERELDPFLVLRVAELLGEPGASFLLENYSVDDYPELLTTHPLVYLRRALGLYAEDLSRSTGVPLTLLRSIEHGEIPLDEATFRKIAARLPPHMLKCLRDELTRYNAAAQARQPIAAPAEKGRAPGARRQAGDLLRVACGMAGVDASELAERLGLRIDILAEIECGARVLDPFLVFRVVEVLGEPAASFLLENYSVDDYPELLTTHPLRHLRRSLNVSREQFGRRFGVSRSQIVRAETGHIVMSEDALRKICAQLPPHVGACLREEIARFNAAQFARAWSEGLPVEDVLLADDVDDEDDEDDEEALEFLVNPDPVTVHPVSTACRAAGMRLRELSEASGHSETLIRQIVLGERPLDPFVMEKLAQGLGGAHGHWLRSTYSTDRYPELDRRHPTHHARRAFDLTPSQVASHLGVSEALIEEIEAGNVRLDADSVRVLAELFPPYLERRLHEEVSRYQAKRVLGRAELARSAQVVGILEQAREARAQPVPAAIPVTEAQLWQDPRRMGGIATLLERAAKAEAHRLAILAVRAGVPRDVVNAFARGRFRVVGERAATSAVLDPILVSVFARLAGGAEGDALLARYDLEEYPDLDTYHPVFYARRATLMDRSELAAASGVDEDVLAAVELGQRAAEPAVFARLVASFPEPIRPLLLAEEQRHRYVRRIRHPFAAARRAIGLGVDELALLASVDPAVITAFEERLAMPESSDLVDLVACFPEEHAQQLRDQFRLPPARAEDPRPYWYATPEAFIEIPPPPPLPPGEKYRGPIVPSIQQAYFHASMRGFTRGSELGRVKAAQQEAPMRVIVRDRRRPQTLGPVLAAPSGAEATGAQLDMLRLAVLGEGGAADNVRLTSEYVSREAYRLSLVAHYTGEYHSEMARKALARPT